MTHRYPFDYIPHPSQLLTGVKLRRKFQQHEHLLLRIKIQKHSRINHECLIRIKKAFESKRKKYFDVLFQWVRHSVRNTARSFSYGELQQKKMALLNICQHLISKGIHPTIAEDLIGITENHQIKLYVDFDFSPVIGPAQELLKAKQIEITNIFRLYERASLFELRRSPRNSMQQVVARPDATQYVYQTSKLLSPQPMPNRNLYIEKYPAQRSLSPPPPYITERADFNENKRVQLSSEYPTQRNLALSASVVQLPDLAHMLHITQKRQFELQKQSSQATQQVMSQNKTNNQIDPKMKPQKDIPPRQSTYNQNVHVQKVKEHMQQQKQYQADMMRQPRPLKLMMKQRIQKFEQQSISIVDTYKQELGEMKSMPRISSAEFRQTTKQPPAIGGILSAEKKRTSTGNPESKDLKSQSERVPLAKLQEERPLLNQVEKSEQSSKNVQPKMQNAYYYRQAFGFGYQKNDPLTRQFISLFEDQNQLVLQKQKPPPQTRQQKEQAFSKEQFLKSSHNHINYKVKQALKNSQRALEMFQKLKTNKNF